jgi:hypothetical protein
MFNAFYDFYACEKLVAKEQFFVLKTHQAAKIQHNDT